MKTQTVWVLPDNNVASSPITRVDPDNPVYQDAPKGDFIPCEAKILNEGRAFFFPDEDDTADVPYETKTIILEKLMPIKGCKTSVETEISTTGTEPNLTTNVKVKKQKNPQSFVFLKKPNFSGGNVPSTRTQDLNCNSEDFPATFSFHCVLNADYSASKPTNTPLKLTNGDTVPLKDKWVSQVQFGFLVNGEFKGLCDMQTASSTGSAAWNKTRLTVAGYYVDQASSASHGVTGTLASNNRVLDFTYTVSKATLAAKFSSTDGIIPQGTKFAFRRRQTNHVYYKYMYYGSVSTGDKYMNVYTPPYELGDVFQSGANIICDNWFQNMTEVFINGSGAPVYDKNNSSPKDAWINANVGWNAVLGEDVYPTNDPVLDVVYQEPARNLTTYNTPCWTFLNDIRRVNKGGKMVMKGTIRYLSYMADLQPEGDDYRDFEPYEIGE